MTGTSDGAPRLSVIIASYNAASTIGAAVASVLDQRDVPLECIVVDDGSTDATASIVEGFAARDPRLVALRLEGNHGVSVARNTALDIARGEWLAFLDADDRLRPGALGTMLRAADAGALLVVVGQRISTDGERTWYPALYQKGDIRRAGRKSLAANPDLLYYVGPAGKLFHCSCADGLRFEGRVLGDQPWVVRALVQAGDRIGVIEDVVYEWWRPHPDRYVPTLTSARTGEAALGIEAVHMAQTAYDLATAAFGAAYDASTRARLDGVYAGRLMRADLGAQLRAAIRRSDPQLPGMLLALAGFIDHVPATVMAASDAVTTELLEPAAGHWSSLAGPARRAFWVLFDAARRADTRAPSRARRRPVRLVLRLATVPVLGRPAGGLLLRIGSAGVAAARRLRRGEAAPAPALEANPRAPL